MFISEEFDSRHHDTSAFKSGQPFLDDWLRYSAETAGAKHTAATFVWRGDGSDEVVAYYSLCAHKISRDVVPSNLRRGDPNEIPAVLLARLALDERQQGQGHGSELLAEALGRAARASQSVAARYVVVDAIDENAATFYGKHGFMQTPVEGRLVRKMSSIMTDLYP